MGIKDYTDNKKDNARLCRPKLQHESAYFLTRNDIQMHKMNAIPS